VLNLSGKPCKFCIFAVFVIILTLKYVHREFVGYVCSIFVRNFTCLAQLLLVMTMKLKVKLSFYILLKKYQS
jgi:hypothetical protein